VGAVYNAIADPLVEQASNDSLFAIVEANRSDDTIDDIFSWDDLLA
jgi:hypothetical protein